CLRIYHSYQVLDKSLAYVAAFLQTTQCAGVQFLCVGKIHMHCGCLEGLSPCSPYYIPCNGTCVIRHAWQLSAASLHVDVNRPHSVLPVKNHHLMLSQEQLALCA